MKAQRIEVPQRSVAWFESRLGLLTSSQFPKIISAKTGKPLAGANTVMDQIIAERFIGINAQPFPLSTNWVRRGTELEPEGLQAVADHLGEEIASGPFYKTGVFGASPDAELVDTLGNVGIELKCPAPATHIGYMRDGVLPDKYRAQVHGHLLLAGYDYVVFASYCPGLPLFTVKVGWDEFTRQLETALNEFSKRLHVAAEMVGAPETAPKIDVMNCPEWVVNQCSDAEVTW